MNDILTESLERFLVHGSSPAKVRAYERGESTKPLWSELEALGYLDALVPESAGGAGLGLRDAAAMVRLLGRHLAPVPLAETMVARALLAGAGEIPTGPVTIFGSGAQGKRAAVPFALTSELALVARENRAELVSLEGATIAKTGVYGSLAGDVAWSSAPKVLASVEVAPNALRDVTAVLNAGRMAGAMDRLLAMTVEYANVRHQFGKPIGKLQAVQQQLAVMTEHVLGANMAAELAFQESGVLPNSLRAAVAKHYTSAAVPSVTGIAHAVHGAIGLSEEYDLQLFVRRLYEWRLGGGSEAYHAQRLGEARLAFDGSSLDFVRQHLG